MTTDEDRREVARKLREAASYYESMERDVYFYLVESALGLKPARETAYTPESVRSLADLIEQPLQCPHYHSDTHYCSIHEDIQPIDRDALLVLADEIDRKSNDGTVNPDPMKPIASSLDLFGYARRIREAVGVCDG